jgi:hypothetical protein
MPPQESQVETENLAGEPSAKTTCEPSEEKSKAKYAKQAKCAKFLLAVLAHWATYI